MSGNSPKPNHSPRSEEYALRASAAQRMIEDVYYSDEAKPYMDIVLPIGEQIVAYENDGTTIRRLSIGYEIKIAPKNTQAKIASLAIESLHFETGNTERRAYRFTTLNDAQGMGYYSQPSRLPGEAGRTITDLMQGTDFEDFNDELQRIRHIVINTRDTAI